ncbi:AmpG family muropeptide MFS transporter [Thalassotalea atypica]|uniref:AmpG family muropeptide MFS transporter n=1 Tax=Thalassotalea atypica TaxID=2054316 RepID=UPI0025732F9D|nr:MFS transporter [Thalassotalea atypica]
MSKPHTILQTLQYFKDRRLLTIFCFGIASGYPWVMIGSAMSGWLKDEGLSRSSIGLFGLIFLVYSINFLWSPLVDRLKVPVLHRLLGQRRSWICITQAIIVILCLLLTQLNVSQQLSTMALYGLIIAIAGATQDIAIDAYRIDILNDKDKNVLAAGSAMATAGWWTGFAGLGSVPFLLVDSPNWQWSEAYWVLAALMAILTITALVVKEPQSQREELQNRIQQQYASIVPNQQFKAVSVLFLLTLLITCVCLKVFSTSSVLDQLLLSQYPTASFSIFIFAIVALFIRQLTQLNAVVSSQIGISNNHTDPIPNRFHHFVAWLLTTLVAPIQEFFDRNGTKLALSILLFIFLFKLGEAYLGRMSIVFYREVGFSNADIAYYSKLINWSVTIVFSLIGSVFTIRYGILKGLFIGGIAMASSNLLFALIAMVGPNKALLAFTVFIDGFTSAWGSVAFVALLSVLCNHTFTASQYALMASLGTFGRVTLGSYSGIIVDWLDGNWSLFFVLTALMVIPSLLFLYSIRKPLNALIIKNGQENTT